MAPGVLQSDSYSEQDAIYNDPNDDDESSGVSLLSPLLI